MLNDENGRLVKTVGKNIKIARVRQGLTQTELAEEIDIHRTTMSKIERGIIVTKIGTIIKITDVLNLTLEDLLSL